MDGPRRSTRHKSKPKKVTATKTASTPKKPLPLTDLKDKILCEIIYKLEKVDCQSFDLPWESLESPKFLVKHLKNLSLVNKKLRKLSIPTLFKYVKINGGCGAVGDPLIEMLEMLAKQSLILAATQYFVLQTCGILLDTGPTSYHHETPDALWKCLELMPNLKEISLRLRATGMHLIPLLESHLGYNPNLPVLNNVRSISIYTAPSFEISKFLKLTPNVENASTEIPGGIRDCPHLLAFGELPHLKYLMLSRLVPRPREGETPTGWVVDDIRAIAEIVPNIEHLALVGQLEHTFDSETRISDYIPTFARFNKLKRLDMTDELVMDAYVVEEFMADEDVEEYVDDILEGTTAKRMANDCYWNEARPKVARKFFKACPKLQKVYLTRCGQGELFERGDGLKVKMVELAGRLALGFPRVLEANGVPLSADMAF